MMGETIKELVLEDSTFEEARQNFNRVLQRLFRNMIDSGSSEGSINLKIEVSMDREYIPNYDPEIEGENREIMLPKFKHKVTSSITVKDELSGNKNPEMEHILDESRQLYVLDYISGTDQRTIFDKDASWNQKETGTEVDDSNAFETDPEKTWMNVPQLPGIVADGSALPGEVQDPEDDVVDGDFREVEDAEDFSMSSEDNSDSVENDNESEGDDNGFLDDGYSYEEPNDPEE